MVPFSSHRAIKEFHPSALIFLVEDVPMTSDQVDDLDASKSSVKLPEVDSNSNRVVDLADEANISVNAFQVR